MSVAGGLCTTVSTTGSTTAGAPFNDCATWIVVADRNLEKPGDKHLVENILDERFQAKIKTRDASSSWTFSIWPTADNICVTFTHNAMQDNKETADWCWKIQAPFSKFCFSFACKLGTQMS